MLFGKEQIAHERTLVQGQELFNIFVTSCASPPKRCIDANTNINDVIGALQQNLILSSIVVLRCLCMLTRDTINRRR